MKLRGGGDDYDDDEEEEEVNIYERLEKAGFFLDTKEKELAKMIKRFDEGKKELDHMMKNKKNLNNIFPSTASKSLTAVLRDFLSKKSGESKFLDEIG